MLFGQVTVPSCLSTNLLHPVAADLLMVEELLQLFGSATGLKTNIQKSCVLPIQCSENDLTIVQTHLSCEVQNFPCKYLGLPLSIKKLTQTQLQPLIDKIADQLPGWKADLLNRAGKSHFGTACPHSKANLY
jgi:hypothetical protein